MSTTAAIQKFADYVAANEDWDDDPAIAHLTAAGVAQGTAEDTVRLVPIAFARLFLTELGVELTNQYIYFAKDGMAARTGELDQNEVFCAATESAPSFVEHPAYKEIAHSSPEWDAVNQALHAGSDPKDLVLGPVAVFLEPPSRSGFEKAQQQIIAAARAAAGLSEEADVPEGASASEKPWWKIW